MPNPPNLVLLDPLFPALLSRPLNGFEVFCGAKVKVPDGGGAKLMPERPEGGKEALVLKLGVVVGLLLPNGENA